MDAIGVKRSFAVWCLDCDMISQGRSDHCIICGSRALLGVARIFDRVMPPASDESHVLGHMGVA